METLKNVPNHHPDNHSGWKIMEYSHLLMGIVGIHLDKISKTSKDVSKMFDKKTGPKHQELTKMDMSNLCLFSEETRRLGK